MAAATPGRRVAGPPLIHDFAPPRSRAARGGIPSDLTTLDGARRGQTLEVRSLLGHAGDSAAMLRPGDRIICRGTTSQWVVVELPGRGEYAVHRQDARCVRVERSGSFSALERGPRFGPGADRR